MSRRFVSKHRGQFPTTRLCELVGVARSSFYEWDSRPLSDHYLDDVDLAAEIHEIHVASRRTYGAPRVAGQLANRGRRHSRKRVARIMGECGLVGVHGRKKWRRGRANPAPAPDLLGRDFTAEKSNQRWVADVTEFRCWDGKLYLAGIFDLHDHTIVGWSMAQRQNTDLVVNALVMALGRRMPSGDLLHHADRGSPYTSLEFTNRLADWGLDASYSKVGDCFDNAAMESVWASVKKELRHLHGDWSKLTRSQLRTALFDYIEVFYNRQRHQARLDHHTPAETYAASGAA